MAKITKLNKQGLDLIKQFEGLKLTAYLCSANVPTIGYGTIRYKNGDKVKLGDTCTIEQAETYLKDDVAQFELAVDAMCTDSLNQNQFNALVSFAYNLGAGALKSSTLLKTVNSDPSNKAIKGEFSKWINAGGRPVKGLVIRREKEANHYFGL
jgi:lysozyme